MKDNGLRRHARSEMVVLIILMGAAIITRTYGIWIWSLTGDEYYTVTYANERASSFINPLYYILTVASTSVFGLSEWSARLPAVILGIISVPVFYLATRYWFGRRVAIIAAILLLVSEWHLVFAQQSRFYSGVYTFGIISYWLYDVALRRGSISLLASALLANMVAVLFHVGAMLLPVACFLFSIYVGWIGKENDSRYRTIARVHAKIGFAVIIGIVPLIVYVALGRDFGSTFSLPSLVSTSFQVVKNVNPAMVVAAFAGAMMMLHIERQRAIFFIISIGIPIIGLMAAAVVVPPVRDKYIIYVFPMIVALAAYFTVEVTKRPMSSVFGRYGVAVILIAANAIGVVSYYSGRVTLDVRDPVAFIENRYERGDKIVAFSHSIALNLQNEYDEDALIIRGGKGAWRSTLPLAQASGQRAWVLIDTYRNPVMNEALQDWLLQHARLVWRRHGVRFDFSMVGYEVYVLNDFPRSGES